MNVKVEALDQHKVSVAVTEGFQESRSPYCQPGENPRFP